MTDVEFVKRLARELALAERWSDIRAVRTAAGDASLAPNELLVFAEPKRRGRQSPSVLRIVVEHLSAPPSA